MRKSGFFSDEFGSKSFEHFFKRKTDGYVKKHFDLSGFSNNMFADNPSIVGRLGNLMSAATSKGKDPKFSPLPKIIVVVPDDDIIRCMKLHEDSTDLIDNFGRMIKYVMTEHERAIASYKEHIPIKSKREGYPQILWIMAPLHDNFKNNREREKFNKAIEQVSKFHSNVNFLELKKVWSRNDDSLYCKQFQRFTNDGYTSYWEAIDRTVRYFDSVVLKKKEKSAHKAKNNTDFNRNRCDTSNYQNDKFRWKNPQIGKDLSRFKKLPTPPPKF